MKENRCLNSNFRASIFYALWKTLDDSASDETIKNMPDNETVTYRLIEVINNLPLEDRGKIVRRIIL